MKRERVYVQVKDQSTNKWHNYKSAPTYDEAVKLMRELNEKYPRAMSRVLDNNFKTHTK